MDMRQREHIEAVVAATTRAQILAPARTQESIIQTSWRRCVHQYGLDPSRMQEARILTQTRLREHQQRIDDFARIARHGLETLYEQVAGMGYVVLLTDALGVTVDYIGDANTDTALRRAGLYLGAEWSEDGAGTCAVGTALATGQALTVHQIDHFDATHIPLTCTAAPLFDSRGALTAILDISALTSPQARDSQNLALQLVRIYVRHIENAIFLRTHRQDWILKLNTSPEFVDVDPEYLIALDEGGRIVGHNRRAHEMLAAEIGKPIAPGETAASLIGMRFDALFEARLEDLSRFVYSRPSELRALPLARSGALLYLSVMPPAPCFAPSTQEKSASAPGIPAPLAALGGGDAALARQLERAAKLVDSPINLLVNGETGSGKEFFAKALHRASARRAGPFVAVNCAAIPETLIESELFGHLPNSFSGAGPKAKRGLIQEADGGTLFLDEIGDMPRELQSRLLRVLAEGEVLAIGASRPVSVDVRVISATHHSLDALMQDGRFREDLYYRLNGARFALPPLRERSDLDWLIRKFLDADTAHGPVALSPAARVCLHRHEWPGNLRELNNVLRYARAVCADGVIEVDDLPDGFVESTAHDAAPQPPHAHVADEAFDTHRLPPEGMLLMQYLRAASWNLSAVARQIGVSRMTLYRRMARYGIRSPNQRDAGGR
ncbi:MULTISPECIES: sigma-54-dependent Fis family transcriptional regulator [unclassified Caballeronia]|uniref:sigma-54-dependent Fis family transcriptional regulator n=1 Tax=unclassified Caballeronia TaxID=2646786 RepID=UPI00285FB489|nr:MULTISPECIES: sigma-54-dependent Fis family transcriptional regulator [unclassified Caballeronia]MDR5773727.1 sigma-54-dependent Fis family transcriptional regulator [Caballeronia sp. LZ002]MDR5849162.1 sigma-54-dependent Fis family transcriptional regulator [Caballeronia sp. LZ003]